MYGMSHDLITAGALQHKPCHCWKIVKFFQALWKYIVNRMFSKLKGGMGLGGDSNFCVKINVIESTNK